MNLENEFEPDQLVVIAQWLETKLKDGYTLEELFNEFTGTDIINSLSESH